MEDQMKPDIERHNISIMHPALGASFPRSQNERERKKREKNDNSVLHRGLWFRVRQISISREHFH